MPFLELVRQNPIDKTKETDDKQHILQEIGSSHPLQGGKSPVVPLHGPIIGAFCACSSAMRLSRAFSIARSVIEAPPE